MTETKHNFKKEKRSAVPAVAVEDEMIPEHVGIIMDGNRRWARSHGLLPFQGHEEGVIALRKIMRHCRKVGVKHLTVYALSTENLKRTGSELRHLFRILARFIREEAKTVRAEGIRVRVIGNIHRLPAKLRKLLRAIAKDTYNNTKFNFNVAVSYGGRDEITRAVRQIVREKHKPFQITQKLINEHLETHGQRDPDLIIRTGGEKRLSNFLLWQSSYSELYFTNKLWPDFSPREFDKAISDFQRRKRNFGK